MFGFSLPYGQAMYLLCTTLYATNHILTDVSKACNKIILVVFYICMMNQETLIQKSSCESLKKYQTGINFPLIMLKKK